MIWKLGNTVCLGRWVGVLWWLGSLSLSVNLDHLSLSDFVGGHTVILELVVTRSSTRCGPGGDLTKCAWGPLAKWVLSCLGLPWQRGRSCVRPKTRAAHLRGSRPKVLSRRGPHRRWPFDRFQTLFKSCNHCTVE